MRPLHGQISDCVCVRERFADSSRSTAHNFRPSRARDIHNSAATRRRCCLLLTMTSQLTCCSRSVCSARWRWRHASTFQGWLWHLPVRYRAKVGKCNDWPRLLATPATEFFPLTTRVMLACFRCIPFACTEIYCDTVRCFVVIPFLSLSSFSTAFFLLFCVFIDM